MSNRQMEERAEQRQTEMLAAELGITIEELELLGYEIEEIGSDDGHPYYIQVTFQDESQTAILNKIVGLDGMNVQVGLNTFDSEKYGEAYAES